MIRAAALALLLAAPAAAQDTDTILTARRAAQQLAQAAVALQEAEGARDRVAALTQTVKAYEEGLLALRDGLRRAAIREQSIRLAFEAKRDEVTRLTGVLMSLQDSEGPVLLLHPAGPLGMARSGMMLAEITPAIQAEAEALKSELEEVATLRSIQAGAAANLEAGLSGVQQARTELSQAIAQRGDLPTRYAEDPEALSALIQAADTMESFAAGMMAVPLEEGAPDTPDFTGMKGTLPLPVDGILLRAYKEPDAAGVRRPGLLVATHPLSLVTTPAAATIRYAGPLLDYGNVIVLEPDGGYLVVLAGLGQTFVSAGEVLPPEAALGLMGGRTPEAAEFLTDAQQGGGTERSETLYIELREGGTPVDPAPWFALQKG